MFERNEWEEKENDKKMRKERETKERARNYLKNRRKRKKNI
jgi:hypothetical protein